MPSKPRKRSSPEAALLLTPGAGAGRDHSCLVAIEDALAPEGVAVERMDFPYRRAGRKAPDRPPVLVAAVREGAEQLAAGTGLGLDRILLGGRSMGGRMCSMAVAEGLPALGLILVSYPLHPPGRPAQLRTEHFEGLRIPCLFVSGTRDAFAAPAELEEATAAIAGPVTHAWVDGGDHALRKGDAAVAVEVHRWVLRMLSRSA